MIDMNAQPLPKWGSSPPNEAKRDRQEIITRLDLPTLVKELVPSCRPVGRELSGICPFHDDHTASMSINPITGAFKCHACGVTGGIPDLMSKVKGLSVADSLKEMEQRAGLPSKSHKAKQAVTGRYDFHAPDGSLLYWKERIEPGRDGRSKEFVFYHGDPRQTGRGCDSILYNLPAVLQAAEVVICEGERKADVLKSWGLVGTSLDSGASSKIPAPMIEALAGKHLAILPDNDGPGTTLAAKLCESLHGKAASIRVVNLPGLQVKGDIVDWVKIPGNDKARLLDLIQQTPIWQPPTNQSITENTNVSFDLCRLQTDEDISAGDYRFDWVWDRMFPERAIILWYAQGGSGKSTLAGQIANAIAKGAPCMDLQTAKRPVVVLDYENPLGVLKVRMLATGCSGVYYWTLTDDPPQMDGPNWEILSALVSTLCNPLLIFDTLQSACCCLDITSNADFSPVMARFKYLRDMGATIVLLHHTPKADSTQYVGASVIFNQVDHVIAQFPVKQTGTDKEQLRDDQDTAHVYRFGSKDKTRFGHHKIYVTFSKAAGLFQLAESPEVEEMKIIQGVIAELYETQSPCQATIIEALKNYGCLMNNSERQIRKLLKKGDGVYWQTFKGANYKTMYRPQETSFSPGGDEMHPQSPADTELERFSAPPCKAVNPHEMGGTVIDFNKVDVLADFAA